MATQKNKVEEVLTRIATPEKQAQVVKGVVQFAISLNLSPDRACELFANLDNSTAGGISYLFGGFADPELVRTVGQKAS